MLDVSVEIELQTTRSGGKGGQNVNKVETAVIAFFDIEASRILTGDQKALVQVKLSNRINTDGKLWVKAQVHRTQLANKQDAITKIHDLLELALKKKKPRIATKPSKNSKERRIESKKRAAEIKKSRSKVNPGPFH